MTKVQKNRMDDETASYSSRGEMIYGERRAGYSCTWGEHHLAEVTQFIYR
ncbi:hypothetical protein AB1K84_08935 [Mesobacillus foraminis]